MGIFFSVLCAGADARQENTAVPATVAIEISSLKHPAKDVLNRYGVKLLGVRIEKKYVRYTVKFSFDPSTSANVHRLNRFCYELLEANSWWAYSLVAPSDGIEIRVAWSRRAGEMTLESLPLNKGVPVT